MSTPEGRNLGLGDIIDVDSPEHLVETPGALLNELSAQDVSRRFPPRVVTKGFVHVEMVPNEGGEI